MKDNIVYLKDYKRKDLKDLLAEAISDNRVKDVLKILYRIKPDIFYNIDGMEKINLPEKLFEHYYDLIKYADDSRSYDVLRALRDILCDESIKRFYKYMLANIPAQ